MKKIFTTIVCLILATVCCISTSAASAPSTLILENRIVEHTKLIWESYGMPLSKSAETELRSEIQYMASDYATENSCTLEEAYNYILTEFLSEIPVESLVNNMSRSSGSSGGGIGNTMLPSSEAGDIFFTDNSKSWNHVGMYTTADIIIEAMPEYGVLENSRYDSRTHQDCVDDSHDQSCIMYVDGADDDDISDAIDWARDYIGCSYDDNFLNNKKNTSSQNEAFNCSELVWKSYRFGAPSAFDLDSNGGSSVYPNNILNSDLTIHRKDF